MGYGMRPNETREEWLARRKRERRHDRVTKIFAGIIVALIFAAFLALGLWVRAKAPCWIFPLKEAPTRCLTIGTDR